MNFSSDFYIRRNISLFEELKNKWNISYIDSYIIAGLYGIKYNLDCPLFQDGRDGLDEGTISLPRNVLRSYSMKLDTLWAVAYIQKHKDEAKSQDFFRKAFETNDLNGIPITQIERVMNFHEYAIAGIEIFYKNTIGKMNEYAYLEEDLISDLISDILEN